MVLFSLNLNLATRVLHISFFGQQAEFGTTHKWRIFFCIKKNPNHVSQSYKMAVVDVKRACMHYCSVQYVQMFGKFKTYFKSDVLWLSIRF